MSPNATVQFFRYPNKASQNVIFDCSFLVTSVNIRITSLCLSFKHREKKLMRKIQPKTERGKRQKGWGRGGTFDKMSSKIENRAVPGSLQRHQNTNTHTQLHKSKYSPDGERHSKKRRRNLGRKWERGEGRAIGLKDDIIPSIVLLLLPLSHLSSSRYLPSSPPSAHSFHLSLRLLHPSISPRFPFFSPK